jgi:hypothetical protein
MATFTYESIAYRFKNATVNGNLKLLNDSAVFSIGGDGTTAGDDLQLTHNGSVGDITCSTGALDINASTLNVKKADGSETMAVFTGDGNAELYSNNTKRFETVTAGAKVTGTFEATGTSTLTGLITATNGINSGNTTITSGSYAHTSGSLTFDVAADIILDADGGDIFLKDGGTLFGTLNSGGGSNLNIKSGSTQALAFSGANATFSGTIVGSSSITASGDITAFSDMNLKSDIRTIPNALDKVSDMRGVYFNRDGEAGTGVIAQEVENILPEVVKDGEYKSVAYGNMVGILIEAIKELKAEVESLKESK